MKNIFLLLLLINILPAHGADQLPVASIVKIQNPVVVKAKKIQVVGQFGISERGDFYRHQHFSGSLRYYTQENFGFEIINITVTQSKLTTTAQQLMDKYPVKLDTQNSPIQYSAGIIYSPIYGKYAWNDQEIVYFDIYLIGGLGSRATAKESQIFFQAGMGMNHYFGIDRRWSLVPEIRVRSYEEVRTTTEMVTETLVQVGAAWRF